MRELNSARDDLAARIPALAASGVWGVGQQTDDNRIVVKTSNVEATKAALASSVGETYAANMVVSESAAPPKFLAGRLNDSAPWNGGSRLEFDGGRCTSGFGVYRGPNRLLTTAGHCGNRTYRNGGQTVGTTERPALFGRGEMDSQVIPTLSSCTVWRGGIQDEPGRTRLTGWANSWRGAIVYMGGSISGERRGVVTASNMTYYVTSPYTGNRIRLQQGLYIDTPMQVGDSGGSIIQGSAYGPLGVASISAGDERTYTIGQNLGALLYAHGVGLNTTDNPNYCTYS